MTEDRVPTLQCRYRGQPRDCRANPVGSGGDRPAASLLSWSPSLTLLTRGPPALASDRQGVCGVTSDGSNVLLLAAQRLCEVAASRHQSCSYDGQWLRPQRREEAATVRTESARCPQRALTAPLLPTTSVQLSRLSPPQSTAVSHARLVLGQPMTKYSRVDTLPTYPHASSVGQSAEVRDNGRHRPCRAPW